MKLPNKTLVVVADAGRQVIFSNEGDEDILNLRRVDLTEQKIPPSRDMVSDTTGRFSSSRSGGGKPDRADPHKQAETALAKNLAGQLEGMLDGGDHPGLVVICDPETLGEVRKHYSAPVRKALMAEIAADLTDQPIPEIEKFLTARA